MLTQDSHGAATFADPTPKVTLPVSVGHPHTQTLDQVCFYLFVLGAFAGLIQLSSPLPFGLGYEMVAIGNTLAKTGSFANPFRILDTGPTAVNPPLYPFFLGVLFKVLGSPGFVLIAAAIGNVVMNALAASWLPRVSFVMFGTMGPGVYAAVLWLAAVRLMPAWDASYTAAGLILFCWHSAFSIRSPKPIKAAVLSGLLASGLTLLNPSVIILVLTWLAYLVFTRTLQKQRAFLFASTVLIILFVPVCLWIARNAHALGAPVLRTNLGMTLYVSNNDCAEATILGNFQNGCYANNHPNDSMAEAELLRSLGEVNYDKRRVADSLNWMQSNPQRFLQLSLQRFRHFWFPQPEKGDVPIYAIWFGTVLFIPGLLFLAWRRAWVTAFFLFVLTVYPLMYYMVVSDVRYRYPVLWLTFLAAGYILHNTGLYLRSAMRPALAKMK